MLQLQESRRKLFGSLLLQCQTVYLKDTVKEESTQGHQSERKKNDPLHAWDCGYSLFHRSVPSISAPELILPT